MKSTILILVVAILSSFGTVGYAKDNKTIVGSTMSEFGDYELTPSACCVVIDNVAYKTWELKYTGTDKVYQVIYNPGMKDNCCFTVRGDNFEIQYARQDDGFGARFVDASCRTINKKTILKQIKQNNLESQKVLTSKEKTEDEYLGLVACFMPFLFG